MKRLIYSLTAMLLTVTAAAQHNTGYKRFESNLQLGAGLFLESGDMAWGENPGATLFLSYGLDVRLSDQWSLMPGAGIRFQRGQIDRINNDGSDPDRMCLADVFVSARYHLSSDGAGIVVGLGPAFSFDTCHDTYFIDAYPSDPVNGKEKFRRCDIGLRPSITFLNGEHFQWGFEGNIGLLNVMRQYPESGHTGSIHAHYLAVTCGWRF